MSEQVSLSSAGATSPRHAISAMGGLGLSFGSPAPPPFSDNGTTTHASDSARSAATLAATGTAADGTAKGVRGSPRTAGRVAGKYLLESPLPPGIERDGLGRPTSNGRVGFDMLESPLTKSRLAAGVGGAGRHRMGAGGSSAGGVGAPPQTPVMAVMEVNQRSVIFFSSVERGMLLGFWGRRA